MRTRHVPLKGAEGVGQGIVICTQQFDTESVHGRSQSILLSTTTVALGPSGGWRSLQGWARDAPGSGTGPKLSLGRTSRHVVLMSRLECLLLTALIS